MGYDLTRIGLKILQCFRIFLVEIFYDVDTGKQVLLLKREVLKTRKFNFRYSFDFS